jgi:hypothetical protein
VTSAPPLTAATDAQRYASIAPAELEKVQSEHDHDEDENRKDGGHRELLKHHEV